MSELTRNFTLNTNNQQVFGCSFINFNDVEEVLIFTCFLLSDY